MSYLQLFASLLLVGALVAGCAAAGPAALSGMEVLRSDKPRVSAPQVPPADLESLAEGNRAFALDLYRALGQDENLFFSPYSISLALSMTYGGARGETEQQMAQALQFALPQDRLHPAFNEVDQQLAARKDLEEGSRGRGTDGKGFRLHIVNDLWGQQNYPFRSEYLDLLATHYGAGLRLLDFIKDPESARKIINDYVAEQTEQRIRDLIPAGAVNDLTRLVLTNAIYFNAAWQYPFEPGLTETGAFTRLDGSQVDVSMMRMPVQTLAYQSGEGYQAVALPYENNSLVMWLLVPDEGSFAAFEASLDPAQLEHIVSQADSAGVLVRMPRFQMEGEFSLGNTLKQLGMPAAFDPVQANFTGISDEDDLSISDVVHKSFVKVDEAGTEAAAATAVIMRATGAPVVETIVLTIDRPFIFLIYDQPTQTVLFMGRVLEPPAE